MNVALVGAFGGRPVRVGRRRCRRVEGGKSAAALAFECEDVGLVDESVVGSDDRRRCVPRR